ncbi:MAG: VOC family protein [Rhodospirillaceae bacterium]|nr:VOC family protein [Rhodospirillaceae bacterium]MBT5245438.1 VOC family protein [Rhodospirillaceae bacterium]MBT5562594.1 VOC family protein [Rhodospirillaceae bacterium]MBT6242548.1 VOC family protein [Rhodospirillaceae bacterium]MBT7137197.1 VOC family protein [Rhodospirillaceae bacterium]
MEQRISLVTLGVANVATARAFYERLGWTASSASMDEVVFFDMGGWMFGLYGQSNLSKDSGLTENKPVPGGITLAYNTRSREEVDHFMDEVKEAGATILASPVEMPWGGYVGYFADPDGHPWEISWVPHFPILEDGRLEIPK